MPQITKILVALMIASFALTACGPSGGDGGTSNEEATPSDNSTNQ